jgi:hypothetical protein
MISHAKENTKGQRESQVYPLSKHRAKGMRETYCKVKSGRSSHQISMVSIGREKR